MESLTGLREESEHQRLARLRTDDDYGRQGLSRGEVEDLEQDLSKVVQGEVRFDRGSRALYATDGSNYRQVPIGVVVPRSIDDVLATVAIARKYRAPLLSRGGGTSLGGQCCNVAVVMDFSKYLCNVLEIDAEKKLATVQPGCVLDRLRDEAKKYGLTFGPDPATHSHCTLGGMLGNNSCGVHSLISVNAGLGHRTSDNTHELEIVTYDGIRMRVGPTPPEQLEAIIRTGGARGEIYRKLRDFRDKYENVIREKMPRLPRRVSGFNIDELLPEKGFHVARSLVGSESTLVTTLQATLHLAPNPRERALLILGYPDIATGCEDIMTLLEFRPTALEGLDHILIEWIHQRGNEEANLSLLPEGKGFMMVEFGGETRDDAIDQARRCMEALKKRSNSHAPSMKLFTDRHEEELIWKIREGGLGSTAWVPGHRDTWPGWEDSAVPPERTADYLRDLRRLLDKYGYETSLYGHFGQGCVHCRIPFDLYTSEGLRNYRSFMGEAVDLCVSYGGSLSGEHGDGQARGEFLPRMFGPELMAAFREFKAIWDPQGRMNPGKKVDAYSITDNLRLSNDYNPPKPQTHFDYSADKHEFARATLRCVGVGNCRREGGGTMCPSYMVTREEKHSTRGRSRMLWEMMNGEVINDGWRSEEVKESLDLCLSCKGCKGDCPVNVDMATYKAEFLSHYYEGRLRPRNAYAFGFIHIWAKLASLAPWLVNALCQTPGLKQLIKWAANIAPERQLPKFAPQSFKEWFAQRPIKNISGNRVVLWADTFNNYLHPETAIAAVETLESLGFQVEVPMRDLCCGRPLYDYGFLDQSKKWLENSLQGLQEWIHSETPIVMLEPSCWSVFRDELPNLLPQHPNATKLSKLVYTLSEFIEKKAPNQPLPQAHGVHALLHGHCHQKSLMGDMRHEAKVLKRMGIDCEAPESGCCGMAGAFGFEAGDHYDVAQKCGERVLLPAVRKADSNTLLMADGFSCREQISQNSSRRAMHLAETIQWVAQRSIDGSNQQLPEAGLVRKRQEAERRMNRKALGWSIAAMIGALAFAYKPLRKRLALNLIS